MMQLVNATSPQLNKILAVFAYLTNEMKSVRMYIEEIAVPALNYYGEGIVMETLPEGEAEVMIGQFCTILNDIFECLTYTNCLAINVITQLNSIYNKKQPKKCDLYKTFFKNIHLGPVFEALSSMLGGLAVLDAVVNDNENLRSHWEVFKRLMQIAKNDPERFGITLRQERQLRKCLHYLDKSVMAGDCFELCLRQAAIIESLAGNKVLSEQFSIYLRASLDRLWNTLETGYETTEFKKMIDFLSLYALFRRIYPKDYDSKIFKAIWTLQKKAPAVMVTGLVCIIPSNFIAQYCPPPKSTTLDPKDMGQYLRDYIQKKDLGLKNSLQNWLTRFSLWANTMKNLLIDSKTIKGAQGNDLRGLVENRSIIVLQGILLAYQIKNYIQLNISLHQQGLVPFEERYIPLYLEGIELIKAIKEAYDRKRHIIALYIGPMIRVVLERTLKPIVELKKKFQKDKSKSNLDLISALELSLSLGRGTFTNARLELFKLAASIVDSKNTLKENDKTTLAEGLWRLSILVNFQDELNNATECSFVYWTQELLTHFIQHCYTESGKVQRLKYLYKAIEDASNTFHMSHHVENPQELKDQYVSEMDKLLNDQVVMNLAREIECDLRLHIHSLNTPGIDKPNPFKTQNLAAFLESEPIEFCERVVNIKKRIEEYLDETFYNMTALNLNDWRVYEEMRSLAKQKYKLELGEVHLPSKTIDQGLDVLEITKKLPSFVAKFKYNLHNQFFIESSSEENNNILVVSTNHISNSLKTHGLGVVNTTINATYRLLAKKFQTFSQFLYDENILNPLMKSRKYFFSNREQLNQMFPYEKAERFNRDIKKLGIFEGDTTYLDKFRLLISHIGNALGIIRMIKAAALSLAAKTTQFIPDTQDIPSLADFTERYADKTRFSCETVDKVIQSQTKIFTEDTNYYKLLVQTFKGVLNNSESKHLEVFFMIIPALTINYVESLLVAKDKITKKKSTDTYFTVRYI
jgi:WASH complex subunit 7